jgi:WD40 repeat protein
VVTSTDGSVIITCSDDHSARVWDGNTYKLVRCGGTVLVVG